MKQNIIKSLLIYIFFFISFFIFYKLEILENYKIYLIIWFLLILIKDILIFFYEKEKTLKIRYDFKKIYLNLENNKISGTYFLLFINRNYIFPFILILYMIYLLISQTHLFKIDEYQFYKNINENLLLSITIASWILTIFKEEKDNNYKKEKLTYSWIWFNILLIIFLSIIWTYIIFIQTIKLWILSYPISIISGILIFLVWISILENNKKEI